VEAKNTMFLLREDTMSKLTPQVAVAKLYVDIWPPAGARYHHLSLLAQFALHSL
jgi:hypothetical protein